MSFVKGLAEFKNGRHEKAVEFFRLVILSDDQNHKAWNALGVCYSILHKYDDADRCFRNAIAISPHSVIYHKNRLKNKRNIPSRIHAWDEPEGVPVSQFNSHPAF